ncbi:unnamed protein product [Arabidopsis halleri]
MLIFFPAIKYIDIKKCLQNTETFQTNRYTQIREIETILMKGSK